MSKSDKIVINERVMDEITDTAKSMIRHHQGKLDGKILLIMGLERYFIGKGVELPFTVEENATEDRVEPVED